MPLATRFVRLATAALLLALIAVPRGAAAQPAAAPGRPPAAAAAQPLTPAAPDPSGDVDAQRVREQFYELLDKYPPTLGQVLKLDPALMGNDAYMAPYPGLAAFLDQHPEIARNPAFFLERIRNPWDDYQSESTMKRREIQEMLSAFAAFVVFVIVVGVVIWLVRTILDTRRWNRMSKTQTEVHTKLLERFSSNEDLLAYIQTPVGRRFLESGPAPVQVDQRPIGAPFSRILLSIQAGIVLTAISAGILYLTRRLDYEVSAFLLVIGVITLGAGLGLLASGGAAYMISSRLGLMKGSDSERA